MGTSKCVWYFITMYETPTEISFLWILINIILLSCCRCMMWLAAMVVAVHKQENMYARARSQFKARVNAHELFLSPSHEIKIKSWILCLLSTHVHVKIIKSEESGPHYSEHLWRSAVIESTCLFPCTEIDISLVSGHDESLFSQKIKNLVSWFWVLGRKWSLVYVTISTLKTEKKVTFSF